MLERTEEMGIVYKSMWHNKCSITCNQGDPGYWQMDVWIKDNQHLFKPFQCKKVSLSVT